MNIFEPDTISEAYANNCNIRKLEHQLQMLPVLVSAYEAPQNVLHLTVNSGHNISAMLVTVPVVRELVSIINLLLFYLTKPVTTATAEGSFSPYCTKTYICFIVTE